MSIYVGNKRKFAAPGNVPFTELPINSSNIQPHQLRLQQASKPQGSDLQQQPLPAHTRQKKKPRVAFGRRVGATGPRKTQDSDLPADSQGGQNPSEAPPAVSNQGVSKGSADGRKASAGQPRRLAIASRRGGQGQVHAHPSANRLQAILEASQADATHPSKQAGQCNMPQGSPRMPQPGNMPAIAGLVTQAMPMGQENNKGREHVAQAIVDMPGQATYNHQAYADEGPPTHTVNRTPTSDDLTVDADYVADPEIRMPSADTVSVPEAQGHHLKTTGSLPGAVRMSVADTGLQQQYEDLVVDLAAQQQQQQAQMPVRRSRLWEQQTVIHASMPDGLCGTSEKRIQATSSQATPSQVPTAAASPSEMSATSELPTVSVGELISLPDDPFQQKLPQHLVDAAHDTLQQQLPQQLTMSDASLMQSKLPGQLVTPGNQSGREATPQSASPLPSRVMIQSHSQLQPAQMTTQAFNAHSSLSMHVSGSAQLDHAQHVESAERQTADVVVSSNQGSRDGLSGNQPEQGTANGQDAAQQASSSSRLLRVSLAEWLADAVASRLWSACKKAKLGDAPYEAHADQQDQQAAISPEMLGKPGIFVPVLSASAITLSGWPRM